ncbi:MAG: hypothetical protein Q9181_007656 [Wetmoreana brouardii]
MVQFLFRKARAGVSPQDDVRSRPWLSSLIFGRSRKLVKGTEWTERLTSSLDRNVNKQGYNQWEGRKEDIYTSSDLDLRLEGPYFSPADPSRYHMVVCIVAGTGVSGAVAIAAAFHTSQRLHSAGGAPSPDSSRPKSTWQKCLIAWSVREKDYIDLPCLEQSPNLEIQLCLTGPGKPRQNIKKIMAEARNTVGPGAAIWAYISGPKGFTENAKTVCKAMPCVDYHAASWDI